jgi:hypothetical protein
MISPDTVKQLAQSTENQCLTLYFNTGPDSPRSAWLGRLKRLLRDLNGTVAGRDRLAFDAAVSRATDFLIQYQPRGNSLLAYATRDSLEEHVSRVPVRDSLTWGKPDVSQLLWLLEEYRPYGVIIADQQHVRFLAVRMNEFEEYREFRTEIDTSEWRQQAIGAAGRGKGKPRGGTDTKAFSARYMEQVRRFWRDVQKPLAELLDRFHVKRLVLAGNKSLLPEFARALSPALAGAVVTQVTLDAFTSPTDAVRRIYPDIVSWEQSRDARLVANLLDSATISRRAAVGIEPVARLIQEGRAARLLVAKDFDRSVAACDRCGHVFTGTGRTCPQCSSVEVRKSTLAAALPRLVLTYNVPVDVIRGEPAGQLAENGGLGAFLRF